MRLSIMSILIGLLNTGLAKTSYPSIKKGWYLCTETSKYINRKNPSQEKYLVFVDSVKDNVLYRAYLYELRWKGKDTLRNDSIIRYIYRDSSNSWEHALNKVDIYNKPVLYNSSYFLIFRQWPGEGPKRFLRKKTKVVGDTIMSTTYIKRKPMYTYRYWDEGSVYHNLKVYEDDAEYVQVKWEHFTYEPIDEGKMHKILKQSVEDYDKRRVEKEKWELAILNDTVQLNNNKYKLVDYWFVGCTPCHVALPKFEKLYQLVDTTKVSVYGYNHRDKEEDVQHYGQIKKIDYALISKETKHRYKHLDQGVRLFPTIILFNEKNEIVGKWDNLYLEQTWKTIKNDLIRLNLVIP